MPAGSSPALCAPLVSSNLYEISWSLYSIGLALALIVASGISLLPYELEKERVPVKQSLLDGLIHARERRDAWRALLLVGFISVLEYHMLHYRLPSQRIV